MKPVIYGVVSLVAFAQLAVDVWLVKELNRVGTNTDLLIAVNRVDAQVKWYREHGELPK